MGRGKADRQPLAFVPVEPEEVANASLSYMYRDGGNYKRWGSVTFQGAPTLDLTTRLAKALNQREYFIPKQVRIPPMFSYPTEHAYDAELDHQWHEVIQIEDVTDAPDDVLMRTFEDFVLEVEQAARVGWQEVRL